MCIEYVLFKYFYLLKKFVLSNEIYFKSLITIKLVKNNHNHHQIKTNKFHNYKNNSVYTRN